MKKMLMCAFLALSLVGGQLSAYKLTDYVTPNRLACVMKNLGDFSDAEINTAIADTKTNGLKFKRAGRPETFNFVKGTFVDQFKTDAGKLATFQDVLYYSDGSEKEKKAIEVGTDTCATTYAATKRFI